MTKSSLCQDGSGQASPPANIWRLQKPRGATDAARHVSACGRRACEQTACKAKRGWRPVWLVNKMLYLLSVLAWPASPMSLNIARILSLYRPCDGHPRLLTDMRVFEELMESYLTPVDCTRGMDGDCGVESVRVLLQQQLGRTRSCQQA